ncbi:hypothetical protein AYK25_02500 [Thermoplasmatales archaeon SM1-50]|nr:MAG: hypothetical protein AYK25_02500 [Thermoplasmatales archaeon SM1-50]
MPCYVMGEEEGTFYVLYKPPIYLPFPLYIFLLTIGTKTNTSLPVNRVTASLPTLKYDFYWFQTFK